MYKWIERAKKPVEHSDYTKLITTDSNIPHLMPKKNQKIECLEYSFFLFTNSLHIDYNYNDMFEHEPWETNFLCKTFSQSVTSGICKTF